jgi:hypothetical protein
MATEIKPDIKGLLLKKSSVQYLTDDLVKET